MTAPLRRAFLAAVPPAAVLDAIEGIVGADTRRGFRWTRREQWHVTIQYFGRVDDPDALVGALAGPLATVPAAPVQVRGAGAFPNPRRAAIYWLGVADAAPLAAVHSAVISGAHAFIRPRDLTEFVAHLTVARLRSAKNLGDDVDALASIPIGPPWTVEEVTLLESETHREGAVYREIARLPLG